MKKIDDIFKEGLDNKGLGYTEAHWGSMAAMLDANKVGFFARNKWLIGIVGLLLTSSIVSFFILKSTQTEPTNTKNIVKSFISQKVDEPITVEESTSANYEGIVVETKAVPVISIGKEVLLSEPETQPSSGNNPVVSKSVFASSKEIYQSPINDGFSENFKIKNTVEHLISNSDFGWLESKDITSLYQHSGYVINSISIEQ